MGTKGATWSLTDKQKAERARLSTQRAMTRDLLAGGIFARLWPAYLVSWATRNKDYSHLLCVDSPAGLMVWRVTDDELPLFEHLPRRRRTTESPNDRIPIMQALAANGWEAS